MRRILIIEDDLALAETLKAALEVENYEAALAGKGDEGFLLASRDEFDLILLDLVLPNLTGFEVCQKLRENGVMTPLIFMTGEKKEEIDKVLGLKTGADDYVTKPFSVREVMARVKAILRRVGDRRDSDVSIRTGALEVDLGKYEARLKGKPAALSFKEFEFLKCLLEAQGQVLTREQLLEKVWGYERSMEVDTRTVAQHVARIRDKLSSEAFRIVTVKNVGYRFKMD